MKSMRLFFLIVAFISISGMTVYAQSAGDYRTAQSGDWNLVSTWQKYSGGVWNTPVAAPDSSVGKIEILPGHTVTLTSNVVVDSLFIDSSSVDTNPGGTLVIPAGDTITVGPPNAAMGANAVGISIQASGAGVYAGQMLVSGTYRHARDAGSFPKATWLPGSTCLLSPPSSVTLATVPTNRSQIWWNIEWDVPTQTANLAFNLTGLNDTVKGNFIIRQSGTGRVYLTSPGTSNQIYAGPINILGDFILYNGQCGANGSSSALQGGLTNYQINVHGNIIVNGSGSTTSWWAITRGSAAQTIWRVSGNVIFSACSLTTSNNADSKIVFVKSGTQTLKLGGVAIGSSSGFSFEVANGSTVDLDTNKVTGTGTFVIDNGGALKVAYGTNSGAISCTGANNTVAYNNFAIATAPTGSGTATFVADTLANTNFLSDPTKSLPRYYTISADAGITAATLVINYPVTEVPGTVTEANLVMAKYSGTGTKWNLMSAATNTTTHVATSNAAVNINGIWVVADQSILTGVSSHSTSDIPKIFYVKQNYPNPFNPTTTMTFGLPKDAYVTAKVYNLMGQEVATLFSGNKSAGVHELHFDASTFSSGVYLYRIQAGNSFDVKRMVLIK